MPLGINAVLFVVAAAMVWWAGSRLSRTVDIVSRRMGLGEALAGMLLLGGITSLPEIAVSLSAGLAGNADLAVSNVLGGVALQVVILAVGDALLPGRPISSRIGSPTVLLQGVFCCLLLLMVVAAVLLGDRAVLGVGLWSTAIVVAGVLMFWTVSRYRRREAWQPIVAPDREPDSSGDRATSLHSAVLQTCALAVTILVSGYVLARTGEAIAAQTGLGQAFAGAVLVGASTSLPEISTVVGAVRLRRYGMAFADIFGTNLFDVMLIFLVDAVASGEAVLATQGRFAMFGALLGVALTLLYLGGLIERRDRVAGRLGCDSWLVLATYLAGVVVLYQLQ